MILIKVSLTLILSWTFSECDSSRILSIFPIPFHEHQFIYQPLIRNLLKQNHQIVLITTNPMNDLVHKNLTQIDLSFTYNLKDLDNLRDDSLSGSDMLRTYFKTMRNVFNAELKSKQIQALLMNKNIKFDAVLVEWFGSSMMNAFAYKFKAPLIGISPGGALINSDEAFGNPTHPIAYPNVILPFSEELNLFQRIGSVLSTFWYRYLYFNEELPRQNELAKKYFGNDLPDLWEIEKSADLFLINLYPTLGNVRPTVPTTVFLGGLHSNSLNKLPKELDSFLNSSHNGVIYINMGSNNPSCINIYHLNKILYAVESLNMDIVWNCEKPMILNSSVDIYFSQDKHQENILAHPNIKLFLTNGGQRNIEDAIHNTVPVLGVSMSINIEHYLKQIQKYEAGIISLINFETDGKFTEQIKNVIQNSIFKKNIKNLQNLVLDNPMTSMDSAIWWIEYTIRHHGTKHLASQMKELSWTKYFLLDVFLAIIFLIILFASICIYIINRLVNYSKSLPFEMVTRGSKCKVL